LRSWHIKKILRKIRLENGEKKISILDAGCGFAQFTYYMARKLNPEYILAVDIKEDYLKDAALFFEKKKIKNVEFRKEDLTKINFDNQFDLIICIEVLEHIQDDIKVVSNFFKSLKPKGKLLITSPSIYSETDEEGEAFVGEHARQGYSLDAIENTFKQCGFEIEKLKYTYGPLGTLAWKMTIKFPLLFLNKSKIFFVLLPIYYAIIILPYLFLTWIDVNSDHIKGSGIICLAKKPKNFNK